MGCCCSKKQQNQNQPDKVQPLPSQQQTVKKQLEQLNSLLKHFQDQKVTVQNKIQQIKSSAKALCQQNKIKQARIRVSDADLQIEWKKTLDERIAKIKQLIFQSKTIELDLKVAGLNDTRMRFPQIYKNIERELIKMEVDYRYCKKLESNIKTIFYKKDKKPLEYVSKSENKNSSLDSTQQQILNPQICIDNIRIEEDSQDLMKQIQRQIKKQRQIAAKKKLPIRKTKQKNNSNYIIKLKPVFEYLIETFQSQYNVELNYKKINDYDIQDEHKKHGINLTTAGFYLHHIYKPIEMNKFLQYNWKDIQYMDLSKCQIDDYKWIQLTNNGFIFQNLRIIIIVQNKIKTVEKEDFQHFNQLQKIVFGTNEKNCNPLSIQSQKKLQIIRLTNKRLNIVYKVRKSL